MTKSFGYPRKHQVDYGTRFPAKLSLKWLRQRRAFQSRLWAAYNSCSTPHRHVQKSGVTDRSQRRRKLVCQCNVFRLTCQKPFHRVRLLDVAGPSRHDHARVVIPFHPFPSLPKNAKPREIKLSSALVWGRGRKGCWGQPIVPRHPWGDRPGCPCPHGRCCSYRSRPRTWWRARAGRR